MFDFHLHTKVSFDGTGEPETMVEAAAKAGLKAICFTDHLDYDPLGRDPDLAFDTEEYNAAYDHLHHRSVKIYRGMEFGMMPDNLDVFEKDLQRRHFDFVIGSAHFIEDMDIYYKEFWEGKTQYQAFLSTLETTLECVKVHTAYDVLGHLTYAGKQPHNPGHKPVLYKDFREVIDEILKILVQNGKGMEINTSGMDKCGVFLPDEEIMRRFKELGGEIVTVGSDAHDASRVGQYCHEACALASDIFGYVCTYEGRRPVFHRI